MQTIARLFIQHPEKVGESYGEHMMFAFRFSARLLRAGLAAFVHGLVPALCETTASTTILDMSDDIRARRKLMDAGAANRRQD